VKFDAIAAAPRIELVSTLVPEVGVGVGVGVGLGVGDGVAVVTSETGLPLPLFSWAAETLHAANIISSTVGANAFVFGFKLRMTPLRV
jgi:hypothetical protein